MLKNATLTLLPLSILVAGVIPAKAENLVLDKITVTAQKKSEKPLEVPIALSVVDELELKDRGVQKITDLSHLSSSVSIPNLANVFTPTMRGIGSSTVLENLNVGIYVDGVSYGGVLGNNGFLDEIERVEILKGPQSTLYGKSAYSGVINVISKSPSNTLEAKIGASAGSDHLKKVNASLSVPLIEDKLWAKISGFTDKKEGFMENSHLNKKGEVKNTLGKLFLRFRPTESLDIDLIQSSYHLKSSDLPMNITANHKDQKAAFLPLEDRKNRDTTLKISHHNEAWELTSLSTYRNLDLKNHYDGDMTPAELFAIKAKFTKRDIAQEFRALYHGEGGECMLGVSAQKERDSKLVLMNSLMKLADSKKDSKSYGIFTHNDIHLSDNLDLIIGARFDVDEITLEERAKDLYRKDRYSAFSPKVGLKYKASENLMSYFTISQGYKPGGYIFSAPKEKTYFDKENLTNYEIGFKYARDSLDLSGAIFYSDIKDKQVVKAISPMESHASNAAKATSQGIELEASYLINHALKLSANFGYTKAVFKDYKDALHDYKGNRMPYAPKLTYGLGAVYEDGFYIGAWLRGQSEVYSDEQNQFGTPSYALVDARIGYEAEDFSVSLYANNLFDREYHTRFSANGAYLFLSTPREVGLNFEYRF